MLIRIYVLLRSGRQCCVLMSRGPSNILEVVLRLQLDRHSPASAFALLRTYSRLVVNPAGVPLFFCRKPNQSVQGLEYDTVVLADDFRYEPLSEFPPNRWRSRRSQEVRLVLGHGTCAGLLLKYDFVRTASSNFQHGAIMCSLCRRR